ncbi:hypothetical protein PG994_000804 [Apiospora phragmitis]|uniref:Uncharacterized protein n=1 Tax=Apiospora phragmitis TaxID=2905665 RepID=A0ABR1X7A6_9PEZI
MPHTYLIWSLGADGSECWAAPGDTNFFGFTLTTGERSVSHSCPFLEQLSSPSDPKAYCLDLKYLADGANSMFDVDPFLGSFECLPTTVSVSLSECNKSFGKVLERRALAREAFLSDPRSAGEKCPEDGSFAEVATENPVVVVLACTNEFLEIIQPLAAGQEPVTKTVPGKVPLLQFSVPGAISW